MPHAAANENEFLSGQHWRVEHVNRGGEATIRNHRNDVVCNTGSLAFLLQENMDIANLVAAAPQLHAACRRAMDWHLLPNNEYWDKYGQPDPGSKNTLAFALSAALSVAAGLAPASVEPEAMPPSDDTQGKLF